MKFYKQVSKVRHGAPTSECALTKAGEIVVGKFVDRDRPDYPYVTQPDILMVMSQEAYAVFSPQLKPGGILIVEQELVRIPQPPKGVRFFGVPATRLAEELGRKVVLNIVMIGFFAAVTHMLDPDSLRQAVADSVPPAMQKLNLQAFDKGFEYGAELVHRLAENGDREHALALEGES